VATPFGSAYVLLGGMLNIHHYAGGALSFCAGVYRGLKEQQAQKWEVVDAGRKYQLI